MLCPFCLALTEEHLCPYCGKDTTITPPGTDTGPRVFVAQRQMVTRRSIRTVKFDVKDASRYGSLITLFDEEPMSLDEMTDILHMRLHTYNGDRDYLLLVGTQLIVGLVTAVACHYSGGLVQLLQWNSSDKRYLAIRCDLKTTS